MRIGFTGTREGMMEEAMRIGFTGTREGMTEAQREAVWNELNDHRGGKFHHGDCVGADAEAHEIAAALGYMVIVHPPSDGSKRANAVGDFVMTPKPYMTRNREIVDSSDLIIAAPRAMEEELRSGTWATIRYARSHGKTVLVVYPDGSTSFNLDLRG